jgi:hypothetical protein
VWGKPDGDDPMHITKMIESGIPMGKTIVHKQERQPMVGKALASAAELRNKRIFELIVEDVEVDVSFGLCVNFDFVKSEPLNHNIVIEYLA